MIVSETSRECGTANGNQAKPNESWFGLLFWIIPIAMFVWTMCFWASNYLPGHNIIRALNSGHISELSQNIAFANQWAPIVTLVAILAMIVYVVAIVHYASTKNKFLELVGSLILCICYVACGAVFLGVVSVAAYSAWMSLTARWGQAGSLFIIAFILVAATCYGGINWRLNKQSATEREELAYLKMRIDSMYEDIELTVQHIPNDDLRYKCLGSVKAFASYCIDRHKWESLESRTSRRRELTDIVAILSFAFILCAVFGVGSS